MARGSVATTASRRTNGRPHSDDFSGDPPHNRSAADVDAIASTLRQRCTMAWRAHGPEAHRFGNRQSGPQVAHFPSGEWIPFRAARPEAITDKTGQIVQETFDLSS
jgi:hypothetical protein